MTIDLGPSAAYSLLHIGSLALDFPSTTKGAPGVIRRLREAISPLDAAKIYSDVAELKAVSLENCFKRIKELKTDIEDSVALGLAWNMVNGSREVINIAEIFSMAAARIDPEKETYNNIASDWAHRFVREATTVSNEYMQQLWADLLLAEIYKPGSVPKRIMRMLTDLTPDEARCFVALCSVSCLNTEGGPLMPIVLKIDDAFYEGLGITPQLLSSLNDQGLIQIGRREKKSHIEDVSAELRFTFGLQEFATPRWSQDAGYELLVGQWLFFGNVGFTDSGRELARTCSFETVPELPDYIRRMWKILDDRVQRRIEEDADRPVVPYDRKQ
ncbi:MAG: DUF2806 domain-containing protein, partial [Coriobacteriales bacterium]|nr:DUF2806 domain-containing protein [Coriobacteriales bacterium]